MTLNPFTLIEKAINEHGSAAILKERIDLARDQYVAIEGKLADATALISQHEATIEKLESSNRDLSVEIEQHKQQIRELQSRLDKSVDHDNLHENEETILKHLAQCDNATIDELTAATSIGKQTIKMHLTELESAELIDNFDGYLSTHWRLTDDGRKRMFTLGLLE